MLENIANVNLTEIISSKVEDKQQLRQIQEIASNLIEGLPLNDSCLLARVEPDTYAKWVEAIPEIAKYMEIQRLTYKRKLLKTLNEQATINGDFKIALQLLISNFPAEYNPAVQKENMKNLKPKEQKESTLEEVFKIIQQGESRIINEDQQIEEQEESRLKETLSSILS